MPKTRLQSLTNPRRKLWLATLSHRKNQQGRRAVKDTVSPHQSPLRQGAGQINIAVEYLMRHVVLQLNRRDIERLNSGKHFGLSWAGAGANDQTPKPLGIYG
jgi:hypothetical protein